MTTTRIMIVDDEAAIRDMIQMALELEGFECAHADNGADAYQKILEFKPQLILLDWMLPGISGIDLARRLRRETLTAELPIIMLSAKGDEANKITGLNTGADDYMAKPFSVKELISRIHALLRRSYPQYNNKPIVCEELILDPVSHRITARGQTVELGPTEHRLLAFFMEHPERAYSRVQLLDQVWGGDVYIEDRTIDVHIRRLRQLLAPFHYEHFIQTVRGVGYRFSIK